MLDCKKLYIELYADLNINISCYCLSDEQKEELKNHLEKFWRKHCMEMLIEEGHNKVFLMKLDEILEDDA